MNDFVKMQAVMSAKDIKGDVNIYPEGVLTLLDVRLICSVRPDLIRNYGVMKNLRDMCNIVKKASGMCGAKVLMLEYNGYTQLISRDLIKRIKEGADLEYMIKHFPCLFEKVMIG